MLNWIYKKIPKYYKTMYQDGFTPDEILFAFRRDKKEEIKEFKDAEKVKIVVEIKNK